MLFDVGEAVPTAAKSAKARPAGKGPPRLRYANRAQMSLRICSLDQLIPEDHPVRIVWDFVSGLDLSPLLEQIGSTADRAGAPAADPRILMSLWLYATLRGIGSARELGRRCDPERGEVPFQWICGEVTVNYHTLADFRTGHGDFLDRILTQSVATLRHEGLVKMERVAQDGVKVRASAGASSFRRRQTLEEHLAEAERQVHALKQELESDPGAGQRRRRQAQLRAAAERQRRIQRALEQLPSIEAQKKPAEKEQARASTTDADARVMKMADGGYRPAVNVQLATDTATQIITGVDVTNSGGDQGKLAPMVAQLEERYEKPPETMLVDGGFAKKEDIEKVEQAGTTVYAPVQASKDPQRDPHTPRPDDTPKVAEWRQRMATPEAKAIYKERASTAECVNAIARNRGLHQFRVRGLVKIKAVVLWYVLAHNLIRAATLRLQAAAEAN
jgi:transposase